MNITREINGVIHEIELTDNELYQAYLEKEFQFDRMDVEDVFDGISDDDLIEAYGVGFDAIAPLIDEMAEQKRRNMDKYDMSWDYARDDAIRYVLGNLDVVRLRKNNSNLVG